MLPNLTLLVDNSVVQAGVEAPERFKGISNSTGVVRERDNNSAVREDGKFTGHAQSDSHHSTLRRQQQLGQA